MRVRYSRLTAAAVVVAGLAAPLIAHAGWNPSGVTVTPTTASIPKVTACSDGAGGTFVAWQEEASAGQGVLRAQHLLATGELDPAWPADGAIACGIAAARADMGALPDRQGGFYLWWEESPQLFVTRLDATGAVAAGWPARGRSLGNGFADSPRPSVIEDGAHGFYAAWSNGSYALATHLGPDNAGAGGWPNGSRAIETVDDVANTPYYPQLALAPDGGVFAAWASWSADNSAPSVYRLRRLNSAGLTASGWALDGLSLGSFHREYLGPTVASAILGLSGDGRGGVFLMLGDAQPNGQSQPASVTARVFRLQGDGTGASDWPPAGVVVSSGGFDQYRDGGPDGSYAVLADARDGTFIGQPALYTDAPPSFSVIALSSAGSGGGQVAGSLVGGHESFVADDGSIFFASFCPDGPYGPADSDAFLSLTRSGQGLFSEYHTEIAVTWYGDIGLAPTGDGGAVFFWSQVRDRVGLFARRFSASGEITAVPPAAPVTFGLRGLRFVPGAGIRGIVSLPDGAPARFGLYDLAGRTLAARDLAGVRGESETTLDGTATLRPGVYFARLTTARASLARRVVVVR